MPYCKSCKLHYDLQKQAYHVCEKQSATDSTQAKRCKKKRLTATITGIIVILVTAGLLLGQAEIARIAGIFRTEQTDWKVGIITPDIDYNEECYRMAEHVQKKHGPDRVVITPLPHWWKDDPEYVLHQRLEVVTTDPQVKFVIIIPDRHSSTTSAHAIRAARPDITILYFCPFSASVVRPDEAVEVADLVLSVNEPGRGFQIVDQAQAMGAETFIHISYPRNMAISILAERRDQMAQRAAQIGMTFVEISAPAPEEVGLSSTHQFIRETVVLLIADYGKNTALFGVACTMMEPLIQETIQHGGIFPSQCCPNPYHLLPQALGITVESEQIGDIEWILEEIRKEVVARGSAGRVASWPMPATMMFMEAGVEYALKWSKGETNGKVDEEKLSEIMTEIAGTDVQLSNYGGYDNFFLYLSDFVVFGESN